MSPIPTSIHSQELLTMTAVRKHLTTAALLIGPVVFLLVETAPRLGGR